MKILMFSSDSENSRLAKYAEGLDLLSIINLDRSRGRVSRFWKGYREAKNLLKKEQFDLITAQEIEHSFIAWRLSKRFNIPWQMQIHTDIFSPYYRLESLLNRVRVFLAEFLIPRASCVRVVSQRIRKSIGHDVVVLPIFSEMASGDSLDIKEKYPGYDFYILMVCRLAREKNIPLALGAMREVCGKANPLLVIVGDGPMRETLESQIANHELQNNVRLEGRQNSLGDYYRSADCLLVTSNYEGYGMAAAEAIGSGLPVIMSDVGVAHDLVEDNKNGIIVPVGDKIRFMEAILMLIKNNELRKRLREGAHKTSLPYASFDEYREKLINSWRVCRA